MRRKRARARGKDWLGGALIGLVLAGLGAFALAGVLLRAPPIDPETLCRTDSPLAAHTIILVDSTDKLEPRHRRRLAAVAQQERARLAQYERLTVMRIDWRNPREPKLLFSRCLPREPALANPLVENPRRAQERWNALFAEKMDTALRNAARGGAGNASPILEALGAAIAEPDFGAGLARRRLVLVSDLLEHQPDGFSLYVRGADFTSWSARADARTPDLSGVSVRVTLLDRAEFADLQDAARAKFWPAYFEAAGAQETVFDAAP